MRNVLKNVFLILVVVFGSIALWVLTIHTAWKTGDWVGGSHIPIPAAALLIAYSPSIIDAIITILCFYLGLKHGSNTLLTVGYTSMVMAILLFLTTAWFLAMGSIT